MQIAMQVQLNHNVTTTDQASEDTMGHMREFVVTRKHVDQVEALLPFLFGVRGRGEAEARDAAEALMAMLDLATAIDISEPQRGA
ncbi:hypothetical protein ABIF94_002481 [Bradyrhizobium ottawaense]|uniref:hypothetical protein n=1 Tax=Bradyrhizobium ottawaense TaxID=931866 RepID=UPI003832CD83